MTTSIPFKLDLGHDHLLQTAAAPILLNELLACVVLCAVVVKKYYEFLL